jgi:hypothetical protein
MITEDDEDEKGLSDLMYKIQYLQLFGLTEYDETMINEKLTSVYKKLENEPFLDELFEFHTYKGYMTKEFMFRTMFSYEYFDLFHRLLYNYYHKLPIVDNVRQLKDQLKIYMDERMREMPSNKEE